MKLNDTYVNHRLRFTSVAALDEGRLEIRDRVESYQLFFDISKNDSYKRTGTIDSVLHLEIFVF